MRMIIVSLSYPELKLGAIIRIILGTRFIDPRNTQHTNILCWSRRVKLLSSSLPNARILFQESILSKVRGSKQRKLVSISETSVMEIKKTAESCDLDSCLTRVHRKKDIICMNETEIDRHRNRCSAAVAQPSYVRADYLSNFHISPNYLTKVRRKR